MIKQILYSSLLFTLIVASLACKSSKKNIPLPGMILYNLKSAGLPIVINVPDTSKAKLEITTLGSGGLQLVSGKNFQIVINPGEANLNLKKQDINGDDLKKLKRFLVDEPKSLAWESQIGDLKPEIHFIANVSIGKQSYTIEDGRDVDPFSESTITQLLDIAKKAREE